MSKVEVQKPVIGMQGHLTVVLDLDGTLISSFTPRRAPRLPPGVTSYVVGKGGRLNPQGVFVVERPGLQEFLSKLSTFAGEYRTCCLQLWQLFSSIKLLFHLYGCCGRAVCRPLLTFEDCFDRLLSRSVGACLT